MPDAYLPHWFQNALSAVSGAELCNYFPIVFALGLQSEVTNEVALDVCVRVVMLYPYKLCLCVWLRENS